MDTGKVVGEIKSIENGLIEVHMIYSPVWDVPPHYRVQRFRIHEFTGLELMKIENINTLKVLYESSRG